MNMTADAIEKLAGLGRDATLPITIKVAAEPEHIYHLRVPKTDGTVSYEKHIAELPPRDHRFLDMESVVAFAKDAAVCAHAEVFYGFDRVVVLCNPGNTRSRGLLELPYTQQFLLFYGDIVQKERNQQDMVRFLRVALAGTLGDSKLLELLRDVKWDALKGSHGTIKHGSESMGRSISSQCSGVGTLPEQVTLHVPVYRTPGLGPPIRINCAVEILPADEMFSLTPFPDAVENAMYQAIEWLGEKLTADLCEAENVSAVYCGFPDDEQGAKADRVSPPF